MDLRSVISMIYTWYEKKNVSEGKFQKPVTSKIERAQTEDQKAAINTIIVRE